MSETRISLVSKNMEMLHIVTKPEQDNNFKAILEKMPDTYSSLIKGYKLKYKELGYTISASIFMQTNIGSNIVDLINIFSIPNMINGVSQQPSALRLAAQAETVINCLSSPPLFKSL